MAEWKPPVVSRSRKEIEDEISHHEGAIRFYRKELDRRGERDEFKYGFPVPYTGVTETGGRFIGTGYKVFATAPEAYDAAREWAREHREDEEAAPYKVHKVYLGKDDE